MRFSKQDCIKMGEEALWMHDDPMSPDWWRLYRLVMNKKIGIKNLRELVPWIVPKYEQAKADEMLRHYGLDKM